MAEELANVEEQSYDVSKLEGVEKAAILLLSLSEEDAAQILKHLEPKQVQKLGSEMAKVDDMTQTKITAVHKHFIEEIQNYSTIGFQSQDFVKRALTAALGEDKAANLIDQILMGSGAKGLDSLNGWTLSRWPVSFAMSTRKFKPLCCLTLNLNKAPKFWHSSQRKYALIY